MTAESLAAYPLRASLDERYPADEIRAVLDEVFPPVPPTA